MRPQLSLPLLCVVIALLFAPAASAAPAAKAKESYRTGFTRWRAASGGFAGWSLGAGVQLQADGSLKLTAGAPAGSDPYPAGGYNGNNFYNGGTFVVGEATSPVVEAGYNFSEAIASWNASTPPGSWLETQITARFAGRWSKWYNLGVWALDEGTVKRHWVNGQSDTDGYVSVDTFVATNKKIKPDAYQIKVRLFSANGTALPSLRNASVATSTTATAPTALQPSSGVGKNIELSVPTCSQMVYSDGGEVWCSPTSTSMVLGFYGFMPGACEPRVRAAVAGVYDWLYDGHGNWPFNTAYAASQLNLEGYVARFTSMNDVEKWVAAGVPVVFSFAWGKGDLTGAGIPSSAGHLSVIVGFDAAGNPIVNDPAHASDATVRQVYNRTELESLWLEHSGGTVYLIYPAGKSVPAL